MKEIKIIKQVVEKAKNLTKVQLRIFLALIEISRKKESNLFAMDLKDLGYKLSVDKKTLLKTLYDFQIYRIISIHIDIIDNKSNEWFELLDPDLFNAYTIILPFLQKIPKWQNKVLLGILDKTVSNESFKLRNIELVKFSKVDRSNVWKSTLNINDSGLFKIESLAEEKNVYKIELSDDVFRKLCELNDN